MIEYLLQLLKSEKKPYILVAFIFLITTLAIFLSYWVFPDSASALMIAFCIIPLMPLIVKLIEIEENRFSTSHKRNYNILRLFGLMFIAFLASFMFWYTVLPTASSSDIFYEQITSLAADDMLDFRQADCNLSRIPFDVTDCRVLADGSYIFKHDNSSSVLVGSTMITKDAYLSKGYFWRDVRLVAAIIVTSLIFGAGALFALAWLASVIGIFVGELIHRVIMFLLFFVELEYFTPLPFDFGNLMLIGIPEMLGFLSASLAGSLITVALIRKEFKDKTFFRLLAMILGLLVISILLIYAASVLR